MARLALLYGPMKVGAIVAGICFGAISATAQIQLELKLPRLQYIAYEPVTVHLALTNLAGRDVELRNENGQVWLGFEVSGSEGESIGSISSTRELPLKVEAGKTVIRKINLTPLYSIHDFGTYRVRAHVYFADLNKFFYSQTRVFEVTDARPIWQKTVGVPKEASLSGNTRTYSLMTNRFPDHTSLYVRVEDKDSGAVYATYSLGRIIAFDPPQEQFDRANQLHVLYCAAPRSWAYARVDLNGQLMSHASFVETKTRPRLVRLDDGTVKVAGGLINAAPAQTPAAAAKLSSQPSRVSEDN
jgi:hypothetical protein